MPLALDGVAEVKIRLTPARMQYFHYALRAHLFDKHLTGYCLM
jgi:hypothetical protein